MTSTGGRTAAGADAPAIVLAGGRGTRIAPVTADRLPKALLPVAGRPFLDHQLAWLAAGGVRRVVLAVGFLGEMVRAGCGDRRHGLCLLYSDEGDARLGTGGALRRACDVVGGAPVVLAVNGDTWFPVPLAGLLARHRETGAAVTVALARVPDGDRYGAVETDDAGRVTAFREKAGAAGGWVNGGVYALTPAAVAPWPGDVFSFERDVLAARVGELAVHGWRRDEPFVDIGVPESYHAFARDAEKVGAPS